MTIYVNSRYKNQSVIWAQSSDGDVHPTVFRPSPALPRRFLHYEVVAGDRLDILAYRFFKDPTLYWLIADANPEIVYPALLSPGSIIRIPQS